MNVNDPKISYNIQIDLEKRHVREVVNLQKGNLRGMLPDTEKACGFLNWMTTEEFLKDVEEPLVIAKYEDKLIGFLIILSRQDPGEFFRPLVKAAEGLYFGDKKVRDQGYCIWAQAFVDKEHRGKGVLKDIYTLAKKELSQKYEIGIGEILYDNQHSFNVHKKMGFEEIGSYKRWRNNWHIVATKLTN